jgi:ABC-type uncharacterized transport system involved in gliding motility auxiliary subunit
MLNKLFNFLGWLGSTLVFAAVTIWLVRSDLVQLRRVLAFAGLATILLYGAGQWRQVGRSFERKQTRYGVLAGTSFLLALAVLIGLNYVLSRQNQRWDLTAAQQYSLSDQTHRVLESLETPLRMLVFAREPEFTGYRDRLDEYAYLSNQVTVEYIDVDKQPLLARQYDVQAYGTIVFDYGGRIERVTSVTEQDLTNGLITVIEGTQQTAYFLSGHGEKDPANIDRDGYSVVSSALALDNFQVESLVLAQLDTVPDDATLVIVAGPQTDLLPGEVQALGTYLDSGGKVLVLIDPPDDQESPPPDELFALLREWGIEPGSDVVVDASGMGQLLGADASVPVAASYPFHPINDGFSLLTAYPLTRSVNATSTIQNGRVAQTFIETSAQSWAEVDLSELLTGEVALNENAGDRPGPVSIAMAVSAATPEAVTEDDDDGPDAETNAASPETRMAVIGDSDFATNGVVSIQGNRDMFLNTVNWLAQQENMIAIRPREPEDRRLTLTADQQRRVFWISLLFLPATVLSTGVYTWWKRR